MFKLSRLFRILLSAGILRMTEEDTSAGGGGLPAGGGQPSSGSLDGGGQSGTGDLSGQGGLQPTASNPWDSVPRSWAQEHHPHWQKTPAEVRQIIHAREQAVEKGIGTYRDAAGRWQKLSSVFQPYVQQNPDLDVTGVYETLAQNHLALMQAEPEERRALFTQLAKAYGVEFAQAAAGQQGAAAASQFDPKQIQALVDARVQQALQPIQAERQAAAVKEWTAKVDAFFSDPKNKYAKELMLPMKELITGGIRDLAKAYQMAALNHPEISIKYLADLAGSAAGAQGGEQGSPGERNVRSSAAGAPPGQPKTIDDTMAAIVKKHYR